jgi:hypothetical protein
VSGTRTALLAAVAYFLVAIVLGFALGLVRVTSVAPHTGPLVAVLLELPVMLAATWFACRAIVSALNVSNAIIPRLMMGLVAFALVLIAEFGIAASIQGRTAARFLASLFTAEGGLGLCAQAFFALFPLLQRRRFDQ